MNGIDLYNFQYLAYADYLGTFTFAISGALVAQKRSFDIFGVIVVAALTAMGGGTIRDLVLGIRPVTWVTEPIYLLVIILAVASVAISNIFSREAMKNSMVFFDAFGLAVFTIIGAQVAMMQPSHTFPVVVVMGVVTGVAGGVLRDIVCNEVPLIFQKEIYASAAALGASIYFCLVYFNAPPLLALIIPLLSTLGLRLFSHYLNWSLPILHSREHNSPNNDKDC
tara:strand:+ start:586 stop:1257 length:672 start_codon:yes stop_codon:yes gene_type:complete